MSSSTTTTTQIKPSREGQQGRRFRTGCKTCKSRRVQCDETRPACKACVRQGRICPGYQREFKWSTKHEVSSTRRRVAGREGRTRVDTPEVTDVMAEVENQQLEEAFDAASGLLRSEGDSNEDGGDSGADATGRIPTVGSLDGLAELYGRIYGDGWEWLTGLEADTQGQSPLEALSPLDMPINPLEEALNEPATTVDALVEAEADLPPPHDTPPQILPSPTMSETTTFLIEYWFKNVCSIWSSFDSDRNLIRTLAAHTWSHNAAVFHSLQTMSALHLAEQLPHLHAIASTSWTAAMQSIQQELASCTHSTQFPTGLLLALAGIGTTTCWTDSQQLGIPLLQKMKTILAYYNQPGMLAPTSTDRVYLEFFNDSCAYWDILCRVVTEEDPADDTNSLIPVHPPSQPSRPLPPATTLTSTSPHPWVGVSRHILDLFAHTLLLCRRHSKRLLHDATLHTLQALIRDIHAARALRTTLSAMTLPDSPNLTETGDARTPLAHLVDVAEGYRLAALLHLYHTFPDLRADRTRELALAPQDASRWSLQTLALELLDLVTRIPLDSGSRVIQPLLYLSIATGLRAGPEPGDYPPLVDPMAIQVSQARRVVLQRVSGWEYSLPAKPIQVLKALIQRIWEVGDREVAMGVARGRRKHWSEVMEEGRLRTMFG
ncbi:Zn(II)2Cys6 transcription factor [Aspergillus saccharolyticus JOP 1030-1]|uniref:Zn(2)-C6 fungal-type domain-containing protein n=1 Tax=Aspergillus saccharolyticus JOP 1030-1 TaxID=1450539 RepID=A0A318ZNM7_9EURO|nr:hypothetical protein BP01DRAFT_389417 [Aspergillus saccharolyticus JOP 1030-1]PYH48124.1 hypothetical protein BP01DRAFT_389417 [Aspergillus saccharolyticus JOP 1030-1]